MESLGTWIIVEIEIEVGVFSDMINVRNTKHSCYSLTHVNNAHIGVDKRNVLCLDLLINLLDSIVYKPSASCETREKQNGISEVSTVWVGVVAVRDSNDLDTHLPERCSYTFFVWCDDNRGMPFTQHAFDECQKRLRGAT